MDVLRTVGSNAKVQRNRESSHIEEQNQMLDTQNQSSSSTSSDDSDEVTIGPSSEIYYENPSFYHLKILKKYFGHSHFRPMQWQIIGSILKDKRDNCAIMSTGYGKSLCYQYPAVYSGGVTLVISPLISLMEDQVLSLNIANISACLLGTAQREKTKVLNQIFEKKYSVVYLTPEFAIGDCGTCLLEEMKKKLDICLLAIDEAHCISSWGHDFRHQYRKLGEVRKILQGVPVLAVTATATKEVENDIIKSLKLKNPQVLHSGYDRPNLFLEVYRKSQQGPMSDFNKVLDHVYGSWRFTGPTIVYCLTRKATENIAQLLLTKSINCAAYHAGKTLKERKEIHEKFRRDQLDVVVATNAFGMGIDKPDVRCVVHYGTPSSLEAYYQEIGRAGRDGEPSRCVLFYSDGDFQTHLLIATTTPYASSDLRASCKEDKSSEVRKYLNSTSCRRAFILSYFGETYNGNNDHCCNNCCARDAGNELYEDGYDFTEDAEKLLKTIVALGGRYAITMYVLFLRGSNSVKLKEEHKRHKFHGCGKNKSELWWKAIGNLLTQENYICRKTICMKGFKTFILGLTHKGEEFLNNVGRENSNTKLILKPPADLLEQLKPNINPQIATWTQKPQSDSKEDLDKELYSLILERRNQIADEKDCMPYNVISIPDIKELIKAKPRTLKDLGKCSLEMFSEFKIHQFGQEFINIIVERLGPGDEVANESGKSMVEALLDVPLPNKSGASTDISYNMLKQGRTIQEISEQRNMAPSTIFGHLLECMKKGLPIKLEQMGVSEYTILLIIVRAVLETPGALLTPIKEKCPPEITWDQIRVVLTYMKIRDHLEENYVEYSDFENFSYESVKSEAGFLNLDNLKCAGPQSETQETKISTNIAAAKTTKEDEELNEFLKICADMMQEDDLKLKEEKGDSSQGEKRKIDSVYFSPNSSTCKIEEMSEPTSSKNIKLYKLQKTVDGIKKEDKDLSDFLELCADIMDDDKSVSTEQTVCKTENSEITTSVEIKSEENGFSSDDEVFRSPPRSEFT